MGEKKKHWAGGQETVKMCACVLVSEMVVVKLVPVLCLQWIVK